MAALAPLAAAAMLLAGAAPPEAGPADSEPLQCGEISPLRNVCTDCCNVMGDRASLSVGMLLFVGQLDVFLHGSTGELQWTCWSILVPSAGDVPLLGGCSGHTGTQPAPGDVVDLRCTTKFTHGPGLPPNLGPYGPWGCKVFTD